MLAVTMRAILLLLAPAPALALESEAESPVSRVVGMLKDLEKKLEEESEAEKDLYDKFVCWGTSTVETKTKATADANARIDNLKAYIADIEAGKLTFTDDKEQREKELQAAEDAIAEDKAAREESKAAYDEAKENAESSEEGLEKAQEILGKAADGKLELLKKNSLISLRGASGAGAQDRLSQDANLQKALEVSEAYLSAANSHYLRRIILGEAHATDGKATPSADITKNYESRNDGIVKKLMELEADFHKEGEEIEQTETEAVAAYDERKLNMEETETEAKSALKDLVKEHATRAQAKEESQDEIDSLTEQIAADTKMKNAVEASLEDKKAEFEKRVEYRTGEMEALGQAIEALTSDDARDLFRKSVGVSFIQLDSSVYASRARSASQALRSVSRLVKDHRLLILAARLASGEQPDNPTYDVVLGKIDNMRTKIDEEEESDLAKKDFCEKNLTDNLAKKKELERDIEDEQITQKYAKDKIKDLEMQIEKNRKEDQEVADQLEAAKNQRDKENAEYKSAKADDEAAVQLIEKAKAFISKFYEGKSFIQLRSNNDPLSDDLRTAGAEDPFKTKSYDGAGSQAGGVQGTMQMVADDVKKEIAVATKEENEAQADYEEVKKDLEDEKKDLKTAYDKMEVKKAGRGSENQDALETEKSLTGEHTALVDTMDNVKPACDFYINNYGVRHRNRETEIKGLDQAKGILKGAFFEDKSRDIKPGDSFF